MSTPDQKPSLAELAGSIAPPPTDFTVELSTGYDTEREHFTILPYGGDVLNVGTPNPVELNPDEARGLLTVHGPKDATPGLLDIILVKDGHKAPRRPTVIVPDHSLQYLWDPRRTIENDGDAGLYTRQNIGDATFIFAPINLASVSDYRTARQETTVKERVAASLLFGAKMRSVSELTAAIERADTLNAANIATVITGIIKGKATLLDTRAQRGALITDFMANRVQADLYRRALKQVREMGPLALSSLAVIKPSKAE